jgi:methionine--tRNA ligase beta chain
MKDIITYEVFSQLDIALGTITAVEIVEGADKLLKLTVSVGEEHPRQIISGIREYFDDVQSLVGKQCPFLLNLQPRVIRGLESQGMILASDHKERFALLQPSVGLPDGTRIH